MKETYPSGSSDANDTCYPVSLNSVAVDLSRFINLGGGGVRSGQSYKELECIPKKKSFLSIIKKCHSQLEKLMRGRGAL